MPKVEGGPKGLNDQLEAVYASCRLKGGSRESCSKQAWGAAKASGWIRKNDKWIKK